MVTELQSRLEKRMDPKIVARLGFDQEAQQDGWHQKWQERVAEVKKDVFFPCQSMFYIVP
eukprot:3635438-Karenia_brevis.AAC.1